MDFRRAKIAEPTINRSAPASYQIAALSVILPPSTEIGRSGNASLTALDRSPPHDLSSKAWCWNPTFIYAHELDELDRAHLYFIGIGFESIPRAVFIFKAKPISTRPCNISTALAGSSFAFNMNDNPRRAYGHPIIHHFLRMIYHRSNSVVHRVSHDGKPSSSRIICFESIILSFLV